MTVLDGFSWLSEKEICIEETENMTSKKYEYVKGLNGHSEIALYVDTFEEVDVEYENAISKGATPVLKPITEPWG